MSTSNFNGVGGYRLTVEARLESQDTARKTSTVYWEMVVDRPTDHWTWSTANMGNTARIWEYDKGVTLWENKNMAFDYRQGNRWVVASGRRVVQHRADGTGEYNIHGNMKLWSIGSAGAGTGRRTLPRLAQVPDAPTPLLIEWLTTSSLRYVFSGNGSGGSPIKEWQVQWQEGSGAKKLVWSNGKTFLSGLKPGTTYRFWARGRNAVGWGPWSGSMTARTHAGARVRYQGTWREAVPYVKYKGTWRVAESHVRHGGKWKRGV